MAGARRARTAEEKRAKAGALAEAARELFAMSSYPAVSVQEIAERAGVSKGTVFLYYPTKEALGLTVLRGLLEEWWEDVRERLRGLPRPGSPGPVAAAVRKSLEGREGLLDLLGLMAGVLEPGAGGSEMKVFRQDLLGGAAGVGEELEGALPVLRKGEGMEVALTLHALLIGVGSMAPTGAAEALAGADLAPFRADVPGAVGRTLRLQLEGIRAVADLGRG